MATSNSRLRRETSVIARVRPGQSSHLGSYSIAMIITVALEQYQDILSIGFSTPNFVIVLASPEIQLAVLHLQAIEGPDIVLDILPWCSDYEEFNLPWIIKNTDEVFSLEQPKVYIQNLIGNGKGLQQHVSNVVAGQREVPLLLDNIGRERKIEVHGLGAIGTGTSVPDFSYLMLVELKSFYIAKVEAFRKCAQSCQELNDYAYQFSKNLDPIFRTINDHTNSIRNTQPKNMQAIVTGVSADIQSQALYIIERLDQIDGNIYGIYKNMDSIIDLKRFKKKIFNSPERLPHGYTSRLKVILERVVERTDRVSVAVTSATTTSDNIVTHISVGKTDQAYKFPPMVTQDEAEADAIYKFLRYKTNVDGYSIIDLNYPILANVVSQINKCNKQITELLLCANNIMSTMTQAHTNITEMYKHLLQRIPHKKIQHFSALTQELLSSVELHCLTANHGLETFRQNQECYEAITLQTRYRSTPERLRASFFAT